ncbi:hypothetical protein SDC9_197330 [bioreactor metagenome]|mgnify:CR=1 FL=1|jgi:uncharacterized membrane protein|uniref:SHOCT domain-containing protein n=1 Tax=bioreactor metagenome TaxID=1076179 RepID=A0A645IEG3_9ZZZZ|nr:SHOCT domain-containing protein [Clostridia bacterium]
MMFVWFLLIGIVVYLLFAKSGKPLSGWVKSGETPEDILTKRFVNGEITEEEYKKMQKIIRE